MTAEMIRKEYAKHEFHPWVKDELNAFIAGRERFEDEKTPESKLEMKIAYEDIFLSTKHAMHEGQISEKEFYRLIGMIQEEWQKPVNTN